MIGKKGQLGLGIITAIMLFLVGVVALNLIKPEITSTRTSDSLDCTNSAISDGTKLTCLVVDGVFPYILITVFSIAGGAIMTNIK